MGETQLEQPSIQSRSDLYELEVLHGLKKICEQELEALVAGLGEIFRSNDPDSITFRYEGDARRLLDLKCPVAVFHLIYFKVPRPQSVMQGGQRMKMLEAIGRVRSISEFTSFRVGAAGSDSAAFKKIIKELTAETGLRCDGAEGQLVIRFRRARLKAFGWDVLLRLTPLPLSARNWRIENLPGALNASIAAAMVLRVGTKSDDRVINLMSGSGTLIIERAGRGHSAGLVGVDLSRAHLRISTKNLAAAGVSAGLVQANAEQLPFADRSFSVVLADLPWGRLIGERASLGRLYGLTLMEATRICDRGGRAVFITQENKLFEQALEEVSSSWAVEQTLRVEQGDYFPKIYFLRRC